MRLIIFPYRNERSNYNSEVEYIDFEGKTIESFCSMKYQNVEEADEIRADEAYDITIKFTDGTSLKIEEMRQAGYIGLRYSGDVTNDA